MVASLSSWPWDNMGLYKYLLYGPFVANVIYSKDSWCLHILILCMLRGLVYQFWTMFGNWLFLVRRRRIIKDGVDFNQIDKEWDWDNFLILQAFMGALFCYLVPNISELPVWDLRGAPVVMMLHVLVSEPGFYLAHRYFHGSHHFFKNYHSHHHSSRVPMSFTAGYATPLEHLVMGVIISAPLLGSLLVGVGSIGMIYGYVLLFDSLSCMGHCNVEIFPYRIFEAFPTLRYLIYTPTYHTLHHTDKNSNFCLFMPLFDALGGTINGKSWELQKEVSSGKNDQAPDFVFLAHIVDMFHSMHAPIVFRSVASIPFFIQPFMFFLLPLGMTMMLLMWAWSKTFVLAFYNLRGKLHQIWLVPRHGFHYFLPFCTEGINKQIEMSILRANKMGVKVISLAALNKNEALNGGGTLFVNKHPDLKVRVVHGNTLTAAVILNEIPSDAKEVFLNGSTSKLGRAIALYLCRKKIRVMMLTLSAERFQKIQKEAPADCQHYLVQVTKYQAAQNCKNWIVGKWITPREQRWAPPGTHFHQFVVPPIIGFRRDCTYGKLAAMKLPEDVQGLGMCEYTLDRGVVHACHAGGVVHFLEGWNYHEVGAIDVEKIDVVWAAAMKHGLKPV
ncbi:uncharacterized protein A4U43_C01F34410 [Asparagus officinalis]|uniref:aldehyde oxygenase (deformylating) n=1 Tax=Asparagus officinalis TaxID=4686 RepID=A0A5P1FVV1_ASPOF|nr:protein ECERIFERUM 3-like [Asparagus officinalis]ONK81933.1 uncharacterized protein A4U43_C01F34410 [Asparagus officinalis]